MGKTARIYGALGDLDHALSIIDDRVIRGSNDNLYDWLRIAQHNLIQARKELAALEMEMKK